MSQTKVVELLKTFSEDEFKSFEKFIESPYFSQGRDLKPLYFALNKFHPDFNFTFEEIYNQIHPSSKFDTKAYNILSTLFSDMFIAAERFLFEQSLIKNNIEYKTLLSKELIERDLLKFAKKTLSDSFKTIGENKLSSEYFFHKFRLYEPYRASEEYSDSKKNEIDIINDWEKSFVIFVISKSIDILDYIETFSYNQKLEPMPLLLKNFLTHLDIESLLKLIKKNKFEHSDILRLYLLMLKLLLNNKDELIFNEFRVVHKRYYKQLSDYENYRIYTMLELCAETLRSIDSLKYLKELMVIYKEKLQKNYYKPEGVHYIHPTFYRSVFLTAIALKEINWAEKFVRLHTKELPPEDREPLQIYTKAKFSFYRKEYSKSLELISRLKPEMFPLKYDIKQLTIQIFYELDYLDELLYQLDSFSHFLRLNKKVTEIKKESYLNFIRFVQELMKLREKQDKYKLNQFISELSSKKNIAGKLWLREKSLELMK